MTGLGVSRRSSPCLTPSNQLSRIAQDAGVPAACCLGTGWGRWLGGLPLPPRALVQRAAAYRYCGCPSGGRRAAAGCPPGTRSHGSCSSGFH